MDADRSSRSTSDLTEAILFVGKVAAIVEMVAVVCFGDASAVSTNKIIESTNPGRARISRLLIIRAVTLASLVLVGYPPRQCVRMSPRGGSIRRVYT